MIARCPGIFRPAVSSRGIPLSVSRLLVSSFSMSFSHQEWSHQCSTSSLEYVFVTHLSVITRSADTIDLPTRCAYTNSLRSFKTSALDDARFTS